MYKMQLLISFKLSLYPDHTSQTWYIIMSLLMATHGVLKTPGKTTTVTLQYEPWFCWDLIHYNFNTIPQLIWKVINSLRLERSIYVLKLTVKIPMQNSVPNQGHWLKLLTQFLILHHFNSNMSFLKGYFIQNYWNNIG